MLELGEKLQWEWDRYQLTVNSYQLLGAWVMDRGLENRSIVYQKTYQFAITIVKAYRYLVEEKKEYGLSKQLLRSGTSIGANCAEAQGAISDSDFSAKISIAYKESLEKILDISIKRYWLFSRKGSNESLSRW